MSSICVKKTKACGSGWIFHWVLFWLNPKLHQWKQHKCFKTWTVARANDYIISYNWTLIFNLCAQQLYNCTNSQWKTKQNTLKQTNSYTHIYTPHSTAEEDLLHLPARIAFGSSFSTRTLFPLWRKTKRNAGYPNLHRSIYIYFKDPKKYWTHKMHKSHCIWFGTKTKHYGFHCKKKRAQSSI